MLTFQWIGGQAQGTAAGPDHGLKRSDVALGVAGARGLGAAVPGETTLTEACCFPPPHDTESSTRVWLQRSQISIGKGLNTDMQDRDHPRYITGALYS